MMIKTLTDVKGDMSDLYEQVKSGACDLKLAAERARSLPPPPQGDER